MFATYFDEEKKLWYGSEIPPLYNPDISLAQALLNSMVAFAPKIAQISDNNGIRMSFAELHTKTVCAAQNLQTLGYQPNRVIATIARNSHHVAPIAIASIAIGCQLISLHSSFKRMELIHMLKLTAPVLMFCDIDSYELVKECFEELRNTAKIYTFGGTIGDSVPVESLFAETHNEHQFRPVNVDGVHETAFLVCTSGTTGVPKVVRWSHAALLDEVCQFSEILNSNDVLLGFATLYFASSIVMLVRAILSGETRIITTENFSPELAIRLIEQYRVTCMFNPPFQLIRMLRSDSFDAADLSSLKCAVLVGGQLPHNMKTKFDQHLPHGNVISTYGMSELSGPMSFDYPASHKKDTSGRLIPGCCVKIIDDDGNRCGIDVKGEVRLKLHYQFLGYFENQEATDEIFDDEGFMSTGDYGHFDAHGDLFISGRKKELIKYGGFHISPAEIDAFLIESPDIKSACVVGIPDSMGDLPTAYVVRNIGSIISEKQIYDMVADHFADHYKLRGGVYFVDSLPTTSSSKLLRRKVKEMALDRIARKGSK